MQLKSIIAVLLFGLIATATKAQQIFKIAQYTQHNFIINPAASGANKQGSVGATYRKMWAGIDGGPQTTIIFADKYFASKKTGVSVGLFDDKTGPTSRTGGQIGLSYSVNLEKERRLMFGLGGQIMQYKVNLAELANSSYFDPEDPIMSAPGNVTKGDASAGVYYKSNTFNMGFSVQQIIQSKLNFIKGSSNPEGRLYRHFYLMADYNFQVDEDNVLIPNVLFKYLPNSPLDFDGGVRLEHKNSLWVGFNYRLKQSYTAYAGLKLNNIFSIGYAYEEYRTPLSVFDKGGSAHEISLRYFLK